jgi:hypothetical protein
MPCKNSSFLLFLPVFTIFLATQAESVDCELERIVKQHQRAGIGASLRCFLLQPFGVADESELLVALEAVRQSAVFVATIRHDVEYYSWQVFFQESP